MAEKKMKRIDKIREALVDDIFTIEELENIMEGFGYSAVEEVAGTAANNNEKFYLSFTNGASEVRIEPESYDGNCVLIGKWSNDTKDKPKELRKSSIVINTRKTGEPTKVRVFQSYDDLAAIMRYFKEHKQYDFLLLSWLCSALGRRVGDTIAMQWEALFNPNGTYREFLKLREDKTNKMVCPKINDYAKVGVDAYIRMNNTDVKKVYHEGIFIKNAEELKHKENDAALKDAIKKQYDRFYTALGNAVKAAGITYPIGSHSFRKWYANTIYKLNMHDPDILEMLRNALGHNDIDTTIIYIEAFADKVHKVNKVYSDYMLNKMKGIDVEINNSPVVTLRTEDFRNILSLCWDKAQSGAEKYDGLNGILSAAEKLML